MPAADTPADDRPDGDGTADRDDADLPHPERIGLGIALGTALGAALGLVVFGDAAIGIGVGIAMGVAFGAALAQVE